MTDLATIIQAVILGLVQGLTEFIPVSSSAHLIIVPWLFGWTNPALTGLTFDVALHMRTLLAVLSLFAAEWLLLIRAGIASMLERKIGADPQRRRAWLLLGTIPGGIVGLLAESKINELFHPSTGAINPVAMIALGLILAGLGLVLFLADRVARHSRQMNDLTLRDSIWIGLAHALAVFPGV